MLDDSKKCPCCGDCSGTVERRRRNTAYVDDECNFLNSCQECKDLDDEQFAELWAEYYAGRI